MSLSTKYNNKASNEYIHWMHKRVGSSCGTVTLKTVICLLNLSKVKKEGKMTVNDYGSAAGSGKGKNGNDGKLGGLGEEEAEGREYDLGGGGENKGDNARDIGNQKRNGYITI
jgi:hypothetical protein